jgi:SAM-dependent methyltransferase
MNEIKKILIKREFKTKLLNLLKYIKRLLLNKGIITIFYKNRIPFYDVWKKEIVNNLKIKKNWRGGRKEFLEWIDFLTFQKIFSLLSKSNNTILEIGSYDGYFIEYYKDFNKIILSDITEYSNLYPNNPNFDFVLLNGHDLSNIQKNSVDVVFSIDTFVRLEKKIIKIYILDLIRIVKPGGYMILHIPNVFHGRSMLMQYTNVSKTFYKSLLSNYCDEIIFNDELHQLSSVLICKRNEKN